MKRMWDVNELIKLIHENGLDPATIQSGNVPQDAILGISADGNVVKGNLFGKYVRIIAPPASTTLTNEEKQIITGGAFVNGEFLGLTNPVFFPSKNVQNQTIQGFCIGYRFFYEQACLFAYSINTSNVIKLGLNTANPILSIDSGIIKLSGQGTNGLDFVHVAKVNGKSYPNFPTDSENKVLACENGTLKWVQNPLTNIAPEYDSTATYAVGSLVLHGGNLYQCSTEVEAAEAWDAAKWTQTTLAAVIASL